MKILAIETSCDETAAAVIAGGKINSNVIASQANLHNQFGGVVPEVAAREHVPAIIPTIKLALKKAKTSLSKIDVIAVTQGPGLMTSLMVGVDTAKTLALAIKKPVIPVNHLEAHIYANFVTSPSPSSRGGERKNSPPREGELEGVLFPALILIVSGGHTMLVLMPGHGNLKIIGETLDDAAGEAFDKSAKLLGLGYPGGPRLSKLASSGDPDKFNFPRPMIKTQDLNFSFSGLKTAVLYKIQELRSSTAMLNLFQHPNSRDPEINSGLRSLNAKLKADLAASIQQAIVDVLIAKTEKAIEKYGPKTIMLGGGVAANELLRKRFELLSINYQLSSSVPPLELATDNAAMIGLAAYYRLKHNKKAFKKNFRADPNLKLK